MVKLGGLVFRFAGQAHAQAAEAVLIGLGEDDGGALYKELQDTVNADSPWAPLVFEMMTAGAVKPLKNFAVLPDGSFDFYQADWQE